ncbi:MAG: transcriptional regulator [Chloroflexi bacterium]|nr:transcriptional regulator [Chloroflexota bacterium]
MSMEIKPIRTEADYEAALAEVERLWGAEPGTPDGDRFEVLFTLVEAYEEKQYPILPPDPVEAIKYYMDSRGLDRRDLEQYIGPSGRVSEVLSRKRPLTLAMIRKLNAGLGIPAEILIQSSASGQR